MSDRLTELRAKLKAREGKNEYRENVKAIRAEIERLEAVPSDDGLTEVEANGKMTGPFNVSDLPEPKEWR